MRERIKNTLFELKEYPSAVFGLFIIFSLIFLAAYSVIAIPYSEAIRLWRADVGIWEKTPRNARPAWFGWFPWIEKPGTIIVSPDSPGAEKTLIHPDGERKRIHISLPFNFSYGDFPGELSLFIRAHGRSWTHFAWHTPDGRVIDMAEKSIDEDKIWRLSLPSGRDRHIADLNRRLWGQPAHIGLFMEPGSSPPQVQKGDYKLVAEAEILREEGDFHVELVAYGRLHGVAGTDHRRRSLAVALMWGTPIALAFAFLAAVGSTLTTMFIAAAGVWFGGWIDAAIQRLTEVNMILPALPIMIMIGTLYSRSIWVMLSVVIILGIFSAGIKTYRAVFLQVKESPYIEAARAYGAGHIRILTKYMIPKVLPMLVPQFVVLIPSFVFLEATLAILGLGDPLLPTWGKVLNDAHQQDALLSGHYYWVILPALLLILTGFGFAMVGFALDRIFNPRLRKH